MGIEERELLQRIEELEANLVVLAGSSSALEEALMEEPFGIRVLARRQELLEAAIEGSAKAMGYAPPV